MSFVPTAEQEQLCRTVREFAAQSLGQDLAQRDRDGAFDAAGWRLCAARGIQGLLIPEEYGGQGQDIPSTLLALEALGESCADNGLLYSLNAQLWAVALPILLFGTPEQQRRYLPALCTGAMIGAQAISEADVGYESLAVSCRAVAGEDGYVLSGRKTCVTNGPIADFAIVLANARPEMKAFGVTAFLVDRGLPGVSFSGPGAKLGLRTSPVGELVLEGARVSQGQRLGPEGGGRQLLQRSTEYERAFIFAAQLGAMRRIYGRCLKHARTAQRFGQPIAKLAPVADCLVAMRSDLELGALCLAKVTWMLAEGIEARMEAAMAKLFVGEAYLRATLNALQIFGGHGNTGAPELEREHRDAMASRIYSGTAEVQRKLIAQHLEL